jgi:hypothetical protein
VTPQIQFIFKYDKPRSKTLNVMTHKMLPIKMALKTFVILEELIVQALLFTDVALVVILVQVLMQKGEIVKPFGGAKFAYWMTREARSGTVSLFQMFL